MGGANRGHVAGPSHTVAVFWTHPTVSGAERRGAIARGRGVGVPRPALDHVPQQVAQAMVVRVFGHHATPRLLDVWRPFLRSQNEVLDLV